MTAYEWRISDWSSDVCSSDLVARGSGFGVEGGGTGAGEVPVDGFRSRERADDVDGAAGHDELGDDFVDVGVPRRDDAGGGVAGCGPGAGGVPVDGLGGARGRGREGQDGQSLGLAVSIQ